jgi:ribosomal protein L11 methyltransferase
MVELLLLCPEDEAESVSDALMDELGALSVSVEDADADTDAERALFGEPGMPAPRGGWDRSIVKALFNAADAAQEAADLLLAQDWASAVQLQSITALADQDWVRLTQSQFTPVPVTPHFWVVPSWHDTPAAATHVIRLDPGMAFGTGTHPTTRMCLRWIAQQPVERSKRWSRVLDYGCGSGILAIGTALHGARGIEAVDIDPDAVQATVANAQANGVVLRSGMPDMAHGEYPLVLANILATPLKLMAPLLSAHVQAGGDLVLAGILQRQADELIDAYAPWLALRTLDAEDGWILMSAHRAD